MPKSTDHVNNTCMDLRKTVIYLFKVVSELYAACPYQFMHCSDCYFCNDSFNKIGAGEFLSNEQHAQMFMKSQEIK